MNLTPRNALVILASGALGFAVGWVVSWFVPAEAMPIAAATIGVSWACAAHGAVIGLTAGTIRSIVDAAWDPAAPAPHNWALHHGTGNALLDRRDPQPDGSYWATEWFMILFLPMFPVARYRVIKHKDGLLARAFTVLDKQPPRWSDALRVYAFVYGLIALLVLVVRWQ
jgi:hypothetical protein